MGSASKAETGELRVDVGNLYVETVITDRKSASLRRLTPIRCDGMPDPERAAVFVGQTYVETEAGMVPIECGLEACTLDEALRELPRALRKAVGEFFAVADDRPLLCRSDCGERT